MRILLTNDDGIYAPGLEALHDALLCLGPVDVVAPSVEQSGVSHSITYLEPLLAHEVFRHGRLFGRAVRGSPADCVKLAMLQFCDTPPDLVVSGINAGANTGINVLYSGTVAGAIEGAFFGVTSIAVSLAASEKPDYPRAARLAVQLIAQILAGEERAGALWNMNLPESRPGWPVGVKTLPMGLGRYGEAMERRIDPRGRPYFWTMTVLDEHHKFEPGTDVEGLANGFVTLTPLHFDLTNRQRLAETSGQVWTLSNS
ncbi:MAG TPA: 5'/3'-nucleotidase SurE [Planctomycetaceae bacterium]|nr:5'/3'-nucleotidase SurE [Planctomycetaceae bacterium]